MTEITIDSIIAQREMVTKFGVAFGENPQYSMFEFQKSLVQKNETFSPEEGHICSVRNICVF